jgi:excisionase family DNA binding protein
MRGAIVQASYDEHRSETGRQLSTDTLKALQEAPSVQGGQRDQWHNASAATQGLRFRRESRYGIERNPTVLALTNKPAEGETGLDGHILTVAEVALFLRVPKSTGYKLASLGQIPARRIGKHWRFLGKDLQERMQRGSNGQ